MDGRHGHRHRLHRSVRRPPAGSLGDHALAGRGCLAAADCRAGHQTGEPARSGRARGQLANLAHRSGWHRRPRHPAGRPGLPRGRRGAARRGGPRLGPARAAGPAALENPDGRNILRPLRRHRRPRRAERHLGHHLPCGVARQRCCPCAGARACLLRLHRSPVRPARTAHRPGRPLGRGRRAGHFCPRRRQGHRGRRRAWAIHRAAPGPHRQHPGALVPGHGVALSPGHRRDPQAQAQLRGKPLGHGLPARHVRRLQLRRWPGHRHQRDRRLRPRMDVGGIYRQPARARRAVPPQLAGAA
jgi:hypothetical protein